jgi:hypothetical protein
VRAVIAEDIEDSAYRALIRLAQIRTSSENCSESLLCAPELHTGFVDAVGRHLVVPVAEPGTMRSVRPAPSIRSSRRRQLDGVLVWSGSNYIDLNLDVLTVYAAG